jgi:hypothetical protein
MLLIYVKTLIMNPGSTPTVVPNLKLKDSNKYVNIITNNHTKMEVQSTPETSCMSNISQTMDNVQHSIGNIPCL